jgi:hypothetical protein
MTTPQLVTVHDCFGHHYTVAQKDLDNPYRTALPLWHPRAKRRYSDDARPPYNCHLHRENICPHDPATFVATTIFGDTWRSCPLCDLYLRNKEQQP